MVAEGFEGLTIASIPDTVDLSKKLQDHSFTTGWLLNSLRSYDKVYQKLHGTRPVKEITSYDVSGGKGFLSIVLRCTVIFKDSIDDNDVYRTILKIPGFESLKEAQSKSEVDHDFLNDEMTAKFVSMHNFECDFYKILAPILEGPVPKVYQTTEWILGEREGCLHMEDLTLRGKTLTFFDNISLTQVKSYIRHLAKMHRNILCVDLGLWKGKFLENQKGFVEALDFIDSGKEVFLKNSKREDVFRPLIDKYHKFSVNKEFYLYANMQSFKDLGLEPVLVHGDQHPGNLMWSIDENGDVQNDVAALVDWQTMHEGSPMSDLARFLVNCADGVVRRQAEVFAFEYYHECLTKEFNNDVTKVPYTVDQLRQAYNYCFLTQAFFTVGIADFFLKAIEEKIPNEQIKEAYHDFGVQKALHAWEDAGRLLQGEMREMFEKYGV